MREYDLIANWYAGDRSPKTGVPEVESLMASLPRSASVLDVGCGTGIPLTRTLLDAGCTVLGVDSSPRMLERFQVNCPDAPFICSPVQPCDFDGRTFDGAIAWGVLFHLEHAEQRKTIAKVAEVLKPGGLFLSRPIAMRDRTSITWRPKTRPPLVGRGRPAGRMTFAGCVLDEQDVTRPARSERVYRNQVPLGLRVSVARDQCGQKNH
jgi:SAM-dependent methyltransferase